MQSDRQTRQDRQATIEAEIPGVEEGILASGEACQVARNALLIDVRDWDFASRTCSGLCKDPLVHDH